MRCKTRPTFRTSSPCVAGTGLLALDKVFATGTSEPIGCWAGGTFGNVMMILSFLGWEAYPVSRLKNDEEAKWVLEDLKRWRVHVDFVVRDEKGSTPIVIEYIRRNESGEGCHRFSLSCPTCGSRLPGYRPIPAAQARELTADLPAPQVFFFDRTSRSALDLAKQCSQQGAVVFFEPSGINDRKHFREAVRISHVVKYAEDRLGRARELVGLREPLLLIETRGNEGLRFLSRLSKCPSKGWRKLAPFSASLQRDGAGAGDWCTAGLIHHLGGGGLSGLQQTTEESLSSGIAYGQALAAWNCAFEGARGGMYRVTRPQFDEQVAAILSGDTLTPDPPVNFPARGSVDSNNHLCSACGES
jgi:hypothetical protein